MTIVGPIRNNCLIIWLSFDYYKPGRNSAPTSSTNLVYAILEHTNFVNVTCVHLIMHHT